MFRRFGRNLCSRIALKALKWRPVHDTVRAVPHYGTYAKLNMECQIAAEPVELRNDELGPVLFAGRECVTGFWLLDQRMRPFIGRWEYPSTRYSCTLLCG